MKRILGFVGSPKRDGNTGILMQRFMKGVAEAGGESKIHWLNMLKVTPCQACGYCQTHDRCVINDDLTPILLEIPKADGIVIGSPVYFFQVSAQTKALIDRFYSLLNPDFTHRLGAGKPLAMIYCQGNPERLTFESYFGLTARALKTVGMKLELSLVAPGLPEHGTVLQRPELLEEAQAMGRKMIEGCK
ncbi:MAG TPA: flavodoxin family protein [Candidatus Ozemobacteraceae bacterium]|nr:flavodoxin family protein [Candidatus Ozemobacteraceae bacterium]